MAKRKRRKASLHSAGKVQEADILERTRALRDEPDLALVHCDGKCVFFSPVAASRKGILKVHAARDDDKKLARLAASGNDLARAYAASLLVARSERIPYVAEVKIGGTSAPYVMRGKAKPLYLAGVQNHDDRQLRLLAVRTWAKKRKMHFYSADRGIVCTARRDAPPRDFVEEEAALLDLEPRGDDRFVCEHGGADSGHDTLILDWTAANVHLERCEECLDAEAPMLATLLRHMTGPGIGGRIGVRAKLAPLEAAVGKPIALDLALPEAVAKQYRAGGLLDAGVLEAARATRVVAIRSLPERVLVTGGRSYGDDVDAFLAALAPTPAEDRAIRAALSATTRPVVTERASSARVLLALWPEHALRMLEAAASDADVAKRLHRDTVTSEEAADLIRRAEREGARASGLAGLPSYRALPPIVADADAIARAYRTQGREAAVRAATERAARGKGIALAFLQQLDAAKGQEWRFTQVDREVSVALSDAVTRLLKAPASAYDAALHDAAQGAGVTEPFAPE